MRFIYSIVFSAKLYSDYSIMQYIEQSNKIIRPRNKKVEAVEADEIVLVDDNGDYKDKDIESDDSDEEFKDTGKHTYQRSYSHQYPECANSNYENPSKTELNRFYELNSVEK